MHTITSPAVHEDNESFPFQNEIISGMFAAHGNDRVTKKSVISGHASQVFHADFFHGWYV